MNKPILQALIKTIILGLFILCSAWVMRPVNRYAATTQANGGVFVVDGLTGEVTHCTIPSVAMQDYRATECTNPVRTFP